MSQYYQPPLTPGFGNPMGNPYRTDYGPTKNPFFATSNQFLPRNLHDVIRWARFITIQSPLTTEVIRKMATYPITEFVVDTEKTGTKAKYDEIFRSFDLKSTLHDIGFEYHTVGNVFISIYFPIHRTLKCPHCSQEYNAKNAHFASFRNYVFEGECPSCVTKVKFDRKDTKSTNISDMNIIKWDPVNIAVHHNPITGEYEYYYKIPNDIKKRVKVGDKLFVNSVPWEFIEAVRNNQDFKFDKNNIFHLRNISAGHMIEGVAVPPLISQFPLVFYQATLRSANEAIASDFMSPLRVVFPQAQTGNSDPVVAISMRNFVAQMQTNIIKHRQDNAHVMIAPGPIGFQNVSGDGKALLVSQEIAQAEESILLSMGVSRELLSGTTNWTSSTVGLRLLENTLLTYTNQILKLVEWIMLRVTKYLSIETCKVDLVPFKLTDDDNLRQMLMQYALQGQASMTTLYEAFGMDYEDELEKIREDASSKAINDARMKLEVDQSVFLATKEIQDKFDQNNDYRSALAKAQAAVEELINADDSYKRQVLGMLKIEDYAMYLMVSKLLEEHNEANRQQMQAEQAMAAANGADPAGGNPGGGPAGVDSSGGPNPSGPVEGGAGPVAGEAPKAA